MKIFVQKLMKRIIKMFKYKIWEIVREELKKEARLVVIYPRPSLSSTEGRAGGLGGHVITTMLFMV